ncbi:hypothetical protein Acsp06_57960 [Actinomycetospora sp. NBRC 106375]|uniref:hypothetical protein n=1 Tax=Actinomycetospora sp. NBRC 106375 TaxID=3032207 RepID=UPI0024A54725|nr:hypothetical protein [Actinomycetospora sp. NBRC 106375]GLZ49611.1 hypothetical protein Acsp06_57960 [Actinomycetospora sp. NBRC 106375]
MSALATVMRSTGFVLVILSLPVGILAVGLFRLEDYHVGVLVAPFVVIALGALALFRGRQLVARAINSTEFAPGHPTVLYLRGFDADVTPRRATLTAAAQFLSLVSMLARLMESWATEEEQLADALMPIGTLVAVGNPTEPLPLPGARRVYVGDDWQRAVVSLMRASRLTVIRPGRSPGVVWELECASRVVPPERLVILVSDHLSRRRYAEIREAAERLLRASLPPWEVVASSSRSTVYGKAGYIHFLPGGFSRFMPIHAPPAYARGTKPQRQMLRYSFWPVFRATGVPWTPLPHIGGCLAITLVMLVALLGGVALVVAASALTGGFHGR